MNSVPGRRSRAEVARPAETVDAVTSFGGPLCFIKPAPVRCQTEQNPVHKAALDRGVGIIDKQHQFRGPFWHTVPGQWWRHVTVRVIEPSRYRLAVGECRTGESERHIHEHGRGSARRQGVVCPGLIATFDWEGFGRCRRRAMRSSGLIWLTASKWWWSGSRLE